jgi:hypothetical protein
MKRGALIWLFLPLLGGSAACGLRLIEVESVAISAQKPSNVAVYLWATSRGEPLTELSESDFRIYEDGQLVDAEQAGLTLLERELAVEHHTVLLVDMSGEKTEVHAEIARGVATFVQRVRQSQGVTVYAFDGSKQLQLVGEFERQPEAAEPESIPALEEWNPRDTSRDLNTAVLEGLMQLDARLMRVQKAVRIGTLVVFSRGPDLAGRVTNEQLLNALDQTERQLYGLGMVDSTRDGLDAIGRSGTVRAQSYATLAGEFESTAAVVDGALRRHYLLSYCSPSRAGTRQLRVEVVVADADGRELRGDVELRFDATGFGPGCDPKAIPRFVLQGADTADQPAADTPAVSVGTPPTAAPDAKPAPAPDAKPAPAPDAKPAPAPDAKPAPGPDAKPAPAPDSGRAPPAEKPPAKDDKDYEVVPPPDKPGYATED